MAKLSDFFIFEDDQQKKQEIKKWKNSRWLFVDTETTGLPKKDKTESQAEPFIVQLGYCVVEDMKVVKTFNQLIDPGQDIEIDPGASAVTGIDRDRINKGKNAGEVKTFEEIASDFAKEISQADVVMAYNAKFDKPVIEREFKLANVKVQQKPWLDPMIWVMKHLVLPNHKLPTVAQHYKISLEHAHDAGADAKAAAEVTMAFVQTFDGLPDDPEEVVKLQGVWDSELKAARIAAWKKKKVEQPKESVDRFSHSKIVKR